MGIDVTISSVQCHPHMINVEQRYGSRLGNQEWIHHVINVEQQYRFEYDLDDRTRIYS